MMTIQNELSVIDRILAGERDLYSQLVNRYKGYAYTIALRILQNRLEAEEAAQDAFIKAYHHLAGFNRQAKFSTWLYRIVFNTAISYRRKHRAPHYTIDNMVILHHQEADGIMEKADKKKFVTQALEKLNETDRTALTLYYLEEFSLEEIAEITGLEANTVKVRIHRARLRLADELRHILNKEAMTL